MIKIKDFFDHWMGSFPSDDEAYTKSFDSIILPVIRRVMPSIIAHDICGVSPMTGPASEIFTLRAKYQDDQEPMTSGRKRTMEQILENTRKELNKKNGYDEQD